jgi:4a-hydroxytetrahydrobiopterin dehydratase
MSEALSSQRCEPCRGGVPPLTPEESAPLLEQLEGWELVENHHLLKRYAFDDFAGPLAFVNRIGEIAEAEGHHPDIELAWGSVVVTLWTHKIDGLALADFVMAAKIDKLPR